MVFQDLLNVLREHSKNIGLYIVTEETKFLIISRKIKDFQCVELTNNSQPIERVKQVSFRDVAVWRLLIRRAYHILKKGS